MNANIQKCMKGNFFALKHFRHTIKLPATIASALPCCWRRKLIATFRVLVASTQTTMMAADEIWKSLSDQYDQQVAEADMELDIHVFVFLAHFIINVKTYIWPNLFLCLCRDPFGWGGGIFSMRSDDTRKVAWKQSGLKHVLFRFLIPVFHCPFYP